MPSRKITYLRIDSSPFSREEDRGSEGATSGDVASDEGSSRESHGPRTAVVLTHPHPGVVDLTGAIGG